MPVPPVTAAPLIIARIMAQAIEHRILSEVFWILPDSQHKPKKEIIEIHQVLKSTFDILAYDPRSNNITLVTDFSPDVPSTMADPHKLHQVFVKLITNAKQALVESKEEGQLTVVTQTGASLYNKRSRGRQGMADPVIDEVIRIIIREHSGYMWAESTQGKGAAFYVELPVLNPDTYRPSDNQENAPSTHRQDIIPARANLLIVEDEESIRRIMARYLESSGYRISQAASG